jgi:hypothetical protein
LLTNLPAGGVDGIVSTANATAITIDSNENVGIGTASPSAPLHIANSPGNNTTDTLYLYSSNGAAQFKMTGGGDQWIFNTVYDANRLDIKNKSGAGSLNTRLSITNDGLSFNGDTASANALDDYEEGSFTATITSTAATFTPNNTTGYYTKVGNLVTISYVMYMAGAPSGTFTNTVSIQGLPFTSSQAATITWGHHRWTEFPSGTTDIGIQLDANATQLRFYARTGISELSLLTGTVFKRNGSGLWLTGHYYTNA